MDRDDIAAWIRLLETPGVGRESGRKLLAAFGSSQAIFAASTSARREVIGPAIASALAVSTQAIDSAVATTLAWLDEKSAAVRAVVTLGDALYPTALLHTADPPLLLYTQGRSELLQAESIAVVGSRNPTPQGSENAHAFAAHLSRAGLTIVSGLALGIDGAAHAGGLEGGSSTIAVVGTGLDRVYPRRHLELAHRISGEGLIVSEYALGTPPLSENFPPRNRIIAGLTRGTLVVEAALPSGSLITARLAAEAGREVFAIPGSIHAPQSRGCHALIKQGAKLVDRAEDILEELRMPAGAAAGADMPPSADAKEDPLLAALGFDPVTLDALVARTGCSAAELSSRLLDFELEGRVSRLPGQLFQRLARG
ncbi:MAG TPA: DNA-processing protein DprA [Caldimonas sp.]